MALFIHGDHHHYRLWRVALALVCILACGGAWVAYKVQAHAAYLQRVPARTTRVVVATPAGRRQYLEVLHSYLARQRSDFSEWQLWLNTVDARDVEYIRGLQRKHPDWIRVLEAPPPADSGFGGADGGAGNGPEAAIPDLMQAQAYSYRDVHRFFRYATDADTLYIRLDDDIVFLEDGFIRAFAEARRVHPNYFLVFANIINNAVIAHKHQASGVFPFPEPLELDSGGRGWWDAAAAEALHRTFLTDVRQGRLQQWRSSYADFPVSARVSINAIAWYGSVMAAVQVNPEDELYLTVVYPDEVSARNLVLASPICAHYSFFVQRPHLSQTDVLQQYRAVAGLTGPGPA